MAKNEAELKRRLILEHHGALMSILRMNWEIPGPGSFEWLVEYWEYCKRQGEKTGIPDVERSFWEKAVEETAGFVADTPDEVKVQYFEKVDAEQE